MEETAGGGDLLMECDEDEEKVEKYNEALQVVMMEEEPEEEIEEPEEEPPVKIIPIPVEPVNGCSPPTHTNTLTSSSGTPPGFMVNGQLIPLLPGGGGAELKLLSHPSGSASGFTTVQIPVTLTLHSPAGTRNVHTASLTACTAPPEPEPTPIITGVVSGEAAQKVLSDHNVNFITQNPQLKEQKSPVTPSRCKPPAANKLLRKGQLGHVAPPDCLVCMSQFKLIIELRGYMCLCSPAIAQSLKNLKRKKKTWRSREKKKNRSFREPQTCSKVSGSQPVSKVTSPIHNVHIRPDDFPSDQFTSPASPSGACSPQQDLPEPTPDPPHGKLVIMVDDFYYGSDCGQTTTKLTQPSRKYTGPYRCIHCPQTLGNNIQLMSHMQQHVSTMSQQDKHMDTVSSCPHCFRRFNSPFKLQCHLEAVHSQYESTAKCKICELVFGSETAFLWHMKTTHRPGEMPYVCQVCDFRSSFYSDVWSHFQEVHADSNQLLCQYCLRVLRSSSCYQQHFARHQRKTVFGCDKCRLHFLYIKERTEHRLLHHRTHIKPIQLTGLKPGTKVTVRTYSVVGGSVDTEPQNRAVAPCKVVDVEPGPPPLHDAPKRRPVESLGPLLNQLSQDSEANLSHPSRCVECLTSVQDFSSHFPSLVHCSLCRFTTCCSKAYANHMINNHAAWRKRPHYYSIFQYDSRLCQRLSCVSCPFSTCRGDMMANHLTERPDHCCTMTHSERRINRAQQQPTHTSDSVTSSSSRGGAFIPIHLLPSGQTSPQLSVKPLTSPCPLSSPAAMTIKFLGPRPQAAQSAASLSVSQLSVLLFSLCNGLLQAACRFQTSPLKIRSWTEQRERQLSVTKWHWKTEKMAAWVLSQREQQLCVSEDMLLQTARRVLGEDSQLMDHYSWAVDFMLRHHLSLQLTAGEHYCLPSDVRARSFAFIHSLSSKIAGGSLPPCSVGFMDELSVFVDPDRFSDQSLSALQLFGSAVDTPLLDVVLSALSDGTFLTPLLFFRGTAADVPDGFPENVLLEARQDGFTEQERLHIWTHKVWRPHLKSLPDSLSLLMVDVHRGHLTDEFQGSMSACSTELAFIPAGCSCCLQPLDRCVTPVLREFLQVRWTQLVSQGGLDGLTLGQLALTLGCWFSEVSSMLNANTNILHRSFSSVCDQQPVEQQEKTANMIQVLIEMLGQNLTEHVLSDVPPPAAVEEVELLLVMQDEEEEERKKKGEQLLGSPPALRQVFDGDSDQDSFLAFDD